MSARFSTSNVIFPAAKPVSLDPADANLCGEWQETLLKLRLTIVVIQMTRNPEVFKSTEFYNSIGEAFENAGIGSYDSSQWQPHIRHFFHVKTRRLSEALKFLAEWLALAGLLEHSTIGHWDATDKVWRAFDHGIAIP